MRQNFAKRFVNLRCSYFATQPAAELGFNHRKGWFDISSLMIMLKKFILIQTVIMKKPIPQMTVRRIAYAAIGFPSNTGNRIVINRGLQILFR